MDFCKNGVMPLMFQEKMRMVSGLEGAELGASDGARGSGAGDGIHASPVRVSPGPVFVFLRFVGGGLMERPMSSSE